MDFEFENEVYNDGEVPQATVLTKAPVVAAPTKEESKIKDVLVSILNKGVDDLNTKFDKEDWQLAEVPVSSFEREVFEVLKSGEEGKAIDYPVMGDLLYRQIRNKFYESEFKLIRHREGEDEDDEDSDKKESVTDKSKKGGKKGAKNAIPKMNAADRIRLEQTAKTINTKTADLLGSFSKSRMQFEYGLYTNKIMELRGMTFAYMAWFILEGKPSEYVGKQSKLPEIYEIMCSMMRFVNTCKTYRGVSLSNSGKMDDVSPRMIKDVKRWMRKLNDKYPFDGVKVSTIAPKLLIHSKYDDCIPKRGISMRKNQVELMDTIKSNPNGFLIFYNAAIASGKTTMASIGIANHIMNIRKKAVMTGNRAAAKTQLIFCCNLASVKMQVARNCWNANIPFGIASMKKTHDGYIITNNYNANNETRAVIIASPDVASLILKEDFLRIKEDQEKPEDKREYLSSKYWLFLDEPTVGADHFDSHFLQANTSVMCYMPRWTVLSSATMPLPDKISDLIMYHRDRFPDVPIHTLITKEINIGCDLKTFENDMVIPHLGCKTKDELEAVITRIDTVPYLGRLYTHKVANQLWKDLTDAGITDITDVSEYFADVDNLTCDNVRKVSIEMLRKLSTCDEKLIKRICSTKILPDDVKVKEKKVVDDDSGFAFEDDEEMPEITPGVNFEKLGMSDAGKYMNMNLIVSVNPAQMALTCFAENLKEIYAAGIRKSEAIISAYEKQKEQYEKRKVNLEKRLEIKQDMDPYKFSRKIAHAQNKAEELGLGDDAYPTINFPAHLQINTLHHWKKYGKHWEINPADIRSPLSIEYLPTDMTVEDELVLLLWAGVGVYAPSSIRDGVYSRTVLKLAEEGKLAYLVSDSSISYGTNYPISRVFITKDFADNHSVNTMFQLMGRAGRVGQSWKAEVYIHNENAKFLLNYMHNVEDTAGDLEAVNIQKTFKSIIEHMLQDEQDKLDRETLAEKLLQDRAIEEVNKIKMALEKERNEVERRKALRQAEAKREVASENIVPISQINNRMGHTVDNSWQSVGRRQEHNVQPAPEESVSTWRRNDPPRREVPPNPLERSTTSIASNNSAGSWRRQDSAPRVFSTTDPAPAQQPRNNTGSSGGKYVPPSKRTDNVSSWRK